jgi:hypothetical protein
MPRWLTRVPLIVWALIAPAVILSGLQFARPDGRRVAVVGAGVIDVLRAQDAPPDTFYELDTRRHEAPQDTLARGSTTIGTWPDVMVIGMDVSAVAGPDGDPEAMQLLARLTRQVENSSGVPVVLSYTSASDDGAPAKDAAERLQKWWREDLCNQPGLRVCVDGLTEGSDPSRLRAAVATGVLDAIRLHDFPGPTSRPAR